MKWNISGILACTLLTLLATATPAAAADAGRWTTLGELHVSDMLNRTAPDLGFSEVFVKAESVEFCSALISHKMAQAAPQNVTICPFTIAVYVTTAEPDKVHLAYRLPQLDGDDGQVKAAVVEMLDGIVQDSL